jgi:hypothetical protein
VSRRRKPPQGAARPRFIVCTDGGQHRRTELFAFFLKSDHSPNGSVSSIVVDGVAITDWDVQPANRPVRGGWADSPKGFGVGPARTVRHPRPSRVYENPMLPAGDTPTTESLDCDRCGRRVKWNRTTRNRVAAAMESAGIYEWDISRVS